MKKGLAILPIVFLVSVLLIGFVSADIGQSMNSFIDGFTKVIEPIAKNLLGETPSGEWLFAKVLFFLIILGIVWTALSRIEFFNDYVWVLVIISAAVSILGTRWMTQGIIESILLPYNALGVAVTAFLPFVIYFILVDVGFKESPAIVRRIAWVFFAVVFIGLWISRADKIDSNAIYIYPITALIALIMAGMDGTIHRFFVQMAIEKAGKNSTQGAVQSLEMKLAQLPDLLEKGIITSAEYSKREREYKKRIAFLKK